MHMLILTRKLNLAEMELHMALKYRFVYSALIAGTVVFGLLTAPRINVTSHDSATSVDHLLTIDRLNRAEDHAISNAELLSFREHHDIIKQRYTSKQRE